MKSISKISLLLAISWSSLALSQRGTPSVPNNVTINLPDNGPIRSPGVESPVLETQTLLIDASDKVNFVYLGLVEGKLVPVTEADTWIFGVRRYIFKTQTGVNGPYSGGAAVAAGEGFAAFSTCSDLSFEADQSITMLGYTIAANSLFTSEWFDYNEEGAVTPMDKFFAVSRDTDCLKIKVLSYASGIYEVVYSQIP